MDYLYKPDKIRVGFQERKDTYTGKLAYIIYYDNENKLRKEVSWNSWRNKNIKPIDFDNKPIEGFVLNKKTGDYHYGWDRRMAHIRVYDPRGFEFEIDVDNLLYILENTNSIKGKGLEGEFVYAWNGKEMILLPVSSPDYKKVVSFSNTKNNNVTFKGKDLIIGASYLNNKNEKMIYLGRFDYYDEKYNHNGSCDYSVIDGKRYFFLCYQKYRNNLIFLKQLKGKLISLIDEKDESYSDAFNELIKSPHYSPIDNYNYELIDYSWEDFVKFCDRFRNRLEYHYTKYIICYIDDKILNIKIDFAECKDGNNVIMIFDYHNLNTNYNFLNILDKDNLLGYYKRYNNSYFEIVEQKEFFDKCKPKYKRYFLKNGQIYKDFK